MATLNRKIATLYKTATLRARVITTLKEALKARSLYLL
jgi:hypothetical protein